MKRKSARSISKSRNKSPVVHFEKTGDNLTSKIGLIPVVKFLEKIGFHTTFDEEVSHERNANSLYSLQDCVFLVLIGLIGGAFNLSKSVTLWAGCGVLQKLAGWLSVPDETTLGRILKTVKDKHINELENFVHALRRKVWKKVGGVIEASSSLWIDVDSSVKTVYGHQEGAAKGYNPHKKGALSYHPLLAFCTATKEILQGWLRTGDAYTSNGIVEFMKQLLAQLDSGQRIVFRGDSGFFVGALLDYLDALGHGYLVKVKLKNMLGLLAQQKWEAIPGKPGWEQCQFWYCTGTWNVGRLLLAVRHEVAKEKSPLGPEFDLVQYDFFCYSTSENLTPWETHKKYGERATSETWIEEAKSQIGLGHVKTSDFLANAALFQAAILAYNTLRWMALVSENKELKQWEPMTVRLHLICVAGRLLTGSNQNRVQLPKHHLHSTAWDDWLKFAT